MRKLALALCSAALFSSGCSGFSKLDYSHFGARASWQRPEEVVRALKIQPGARVADLGAGDGYFVPYLAEAVGSAGRVYAVDVEAEITQELEERFGGPDTNVDVVLAGYDDPDLPDGGVDLVLIVNTYHHIEERPAYFAKLRRDLSPRGRVAVLEPDAELGGLLSLFVKDGHASTAAALDGEMRSAGYRRSESFEFLPVQIFEVFAPESANN